MSIFSKEYEDYDMVGSSLVGDAIIFDLIDKLAASTQKIGDYSKSLVEVSKRRNERLLPLVNISPIKKFFSKIKAFFVQPEPVDLSLTDEGRGILDNSSQEYLSSNSEIENYNLKDNIIQSLVKRIAGPQKNDRFYKAHRYNASDVPGLLDECVISDFKKLGLEHLVPQLQEALIEEYKKDLPDNEVHNDLKSFETEQSNDRKKVETNEREERD